MSCAAQSVKRLIKKRALARYSAYTMLQVEQLSATFPCCVVVWFLIGFMSLIAQPSTSLQQHPLHIRCVLVAIGFACLWAHLQPRDPGVYVQAQEGQKSFMPDLQH